MRRIPQGVPVIVVSDVDGTLLDESHKFPLDTIRMRRVIAHALASRDAPAVFTLASSRSLVELVVLQRLLAIRGPLIGEDGGVLAIDRQAPLPLAEVSADEQRILGRTFDVVHIGADSESVRSRLLNSDPTMSKFVLADMSPGRLSELGFDSPRAVHRAIRSREASVLLDLDELDDVERELRIDGANRAGVTVKRGGRWCTAVIGADKGRALQQLCTMVANALGQTPFIVAIGNEENDAALLAQADLPLVIRNPGRGHHPGLTAVPRAVPLESEGTQGFLEMLRMLGEVSEATST